MFTGYFIADIADIADITKNGKLCKEIGISNIGTEPTSNRGFVHYKT